MYRYSNKKIYHEREQYEIFWVTEFAEHIVHKESHHSHKINLREVELLAPELVYFNYKGRLTVGLGRFKGKIYNIFAFFVKRKSYKRCVIKTCYICNDPYLLQIAKQQGL